MSATMPAPMPAPMSAPVPVVRRPAPPLSVDALARTARPLAEATGLPNAAYTDEAVFGFERDAVFAPNWAALLFVDSLAEGHVRPIDFMGVPLYAHRTAAHGVRVFHNVCSHRGMRLVDEERKVRGNGNVVCPYHCWTYAPDGELLKTPHVGGFGVHAHEKLDRAAHGLKEVRAHVWNRIVFVNLDGRAAPFGVAAAPVIERYRALAGADAEGRLRAPATHAGTRIELACNWKLACENYLEAYHLPFVHPGLAAYSPVDDHAGEFMSDACAGQVSGDFATQGDPQNAFPGFPGWDPARTRTAEYPVLYPNLLLGFQVDHAFAIIVTPVSAARAVQELTIFYAGDEAATSERFEAGRRSNLEAWHAVFEEDRGPCERMQAGRASPAYSGGAFSPVLDACPHHFQRWVAQRYSTAAAGPGSSDA